MLSLADVFPAELTDSADRDHVERVHLTEVADQRLGESVGR